MMGGVVSSQPITPNGNHANHQHHHQHHQLAPYTESENVPSDRNPPISGNHHSSPKSLSTLQQETINLIDMQQQTMKSQEKVMIG